MRIKPKIFRHWQGVVYKTGGEFRGFPAAPQRICTADPGTMGWDEEITKALNGILVAEDVFNQIIKMAEQGRTIAGAPAQIARDAVFFQEAVTLVREARKSITAPVPPRP